MSAKRRLRVGGRASHLAVAQSRLVMSAIAAAHPELELELVTFRTTGDVNMKPFAEASDPAGIKGLFTLELERALLGGTQPEGPAHGSGPPPAHRGVLAAG